LEISKESGWGIARSGLGFISIYRHKLILQALKGGKPISAEESPFRLLCSNSSKSRDFLAIYFKIVGKGYSITESAQILSRILKNMAHDFLQRPVFREFDSRIWGRLKFS
jgi:hypothetical protein